MEGREEDKGYLDILKLLIKHGVDQNSIQKAFSTACYESNSLIIDFLLSCGARVNEGILFNNDYYCFLTSNCY